MSRRRRTWWALPAVALVALAAGAADGAQVPEPGPRVVAGAAPRLAAIALRSRTLAPPRGVDAAGITAQRRLPGARRSHFVVQLDGLPSAAARARLRRGGVELGAYLGGGAYTASAPTAGLGDRLEALPGVRAAVPLAARDKQGPALRAGRIPDGARRGRTVLVNLALHERVPLADADAIVRAAAGGVLDRSRVLNAVTAAVPAARVDAIAAMDAVSYVDVAEPRGRPKLHRVRERLRTEAVTEGPEGVTGAGATGLIVDIGVLDGAHPDFAGRIAGAEAGELPGDHATHVAGIFGGSGAGSTAQGGTAGQWRGIAPGARIRSADASSANWYASFGDLEDDVADALGEDSQGVDLVSMSLGDTATADHPCATLGDYTLASRMVDFIATGAIGDRKLPYFLANGNERFVTTYDGGPMLCQAYNTVISPATAKNAISVGATNTDGDVAANRRVIPTWASFGPTDDGRIKPDLTAPGCSTTTGIKAAAFTDTSKDGFRQPTETTGVYAEMCGTSMAAPAAAGVGALITELWRRRSAAPPSPATLKAIMVHTAAEPPAGQGFRLGVIESGKLTPETVAPAPGKPGPDAIHGWGMLDAAAAAALVEDHQKSPRIREAPIANGETRAWSFLSDGSTAPKVTLTWDDPPASPLSAKTLVNDLDVELVAPGGQVFQTWTIDPTPSLPASRAAEQHHAPAFRGKDARNTVEQATGEPQAGTWVVRVRGAAVAQGPQRFTLVAPAGTRNHAPVAADLAVALDEDTAAGVTLTGSDAEGDALTYTVVQPPAHGRLEGEPPALTYHPAPGYAGEDAFTYRATDGGGASTEATVRLRVRPVNDAPTAAAGVVQALEDEPVAIDLRLLTADQETGAADLTYTVVSPPPGGTLSGAGGLLTFTPGDGPARVESLGFRVTDRGDPDGCALASDACDVARDSELATVTIVVLERNDPPVAVDDGPITVAEDGAVTIDARANDTAVETGDALRLDWVGAPAHGTATGVDGAIRYIPAGDYHGADELRYRVCDDGRTNGMPDPRCAEATVRVTVSAVNDEPIVRADAAAALEGTAVTVDVLANDSPGPVDEAAQVLRISGIVAAPGNGVATLAPGGIRYVPAAGFTGQDTLVYEACDGADTDLRRRCAQADVRITVSGVNDAPSVTLQAPATVDEGTQAPLRAVATDPDGDDLRYEWHVVGAALTADGAGATLAATDGPKDVTVTVVVRDGRGGAVTGTAVIAVRNVAPVGAAGPDRAIPWGVPVTLAASGLADAGSVDAAALNATWSFDDGTPDLTGAAVARAFDVPGRRVTRLTVRDKDGAAVTDDAVVDVTRREARVAFAGPATSRFGPLQLRARVTDAVDAATARLAGRAVEFEAAGVRRTATLDAQGVATVRLDPPPFAGGAQVTARFAGDDRYTPASVVAALRTTNGAGRVTARGVRLGGRLRADVQVRSSGRRVTGHLRTTGPTLRSTSLTAFAVEAGGRVAWLAGRAGRRSFVARLEETRRGRGQLRVWIGGRLVAGGGAVRGGRVDVAPRR